ncbi:YraN family protein [Microbacterium sp. CIAB417]|uniref:YraN family protein n=1 Tax=Microbacterium sp. CIAB417 TaxID=2860287 RepID=UPI001FABA622|nr:YraN family protein [Microbacterium sp. CIAB417]
MAAKDDLGRSGEARAVAHLGDRGYSILDRNWRCPAGEVDIVASHRGMLCVVEVKTRTSLRYGHPFEALDERKVGRLWRLAHAWIEAHPGLAVHSRVRLEAIGIVGADPRTGTLEHLVDLR